LADISLLMQGFDPTNNHSIRLSDFLSKPNIEEVIFSVAFVKTSGIRFIEANLDAVHEKVVFFIGIRNGITSIQAIFKLLEMKVKIFVVDTGATSVVYHPKVFIIDTRDFIYSIFGSANLTAGGLFNNIEFSSVIKFEKHDIEINKFKRKILNLPSEYPDNIFEVNTKKQAFLLYKNGLLTDERVTHASLFSPSVEQETTKDHTPKMMLNRPPLPVTQHVNRKPSPSVSKKTIPILDQWILVWESKKLKERDLCIPSSTGTNPTGSMLFKKGNFEDIDQREYFRNEVFKEIQWSHDVKKPHYERAMAHFILEIRGINYGLHTLRLSHDTNRESVSYIQNNSMTQVHWGDVMDLIRDRELLGETLKLYKQNSTPPVYMIKIG
jgi:HKD family nuclease